eukprot:TRINITY_DN21856_c0_g1_i1.p1 TRINITY_DN21856_c0_g1~~TRINITY_DN21856_c0_g1_i1.p1  ORF type:complete len:418 (-),score=110.57 TRINITY_DN21856_c0_g1_i1:113-1366(-)
MCIRDRVSTQSTGFSTQKMRGIPRVARIRNDKLRQLLTKYPSTKVYNWKTLSSFLNDIKVVPTEELSKEVEVTVQRLRAESNEASTVFSREFDDAGYPSWIQERKDEIVPSAADNALDESNVEKLVVGPWIRRFANTLYPSDWGDYQLKFIDAEAGPAEKQFWKKTLKDLQTKDKEHEAFMQNVLSELQAEFGDDKVKELKKVIGSARTLAKKNFEDTKQRYEKFNNDAKKVVQDGAAKTAAAIANVVDWFSADMKDLGQNAAREFDRDWKIDDLLDEYQSHVLGRHVNLQLFDKFDVPDTVTKTYQEWDTVEQKRADELQDMKETVFLKAFEKFEGYAAEATEKIAEIDAEIARTKDDQEKLVTVDIQQFYEDHPEWWAKADWLITRHRWDSDLSDADYAERLKDDHLWWNLPRND